LTRFVERENLIMWMGMHRFTRVTNAISKMVDNLATCVTPATYNFARPQQALTRRYGKKTTPAMATVVADHVMSPWEIAGLLN
jgi:hypothetical protein